MIKMNYAGYDEKTLLVPSEDAFSIECYLQDVKFLQQKNGYAEYFFTFIPYTSSDDMSLELAMASAISKLEMRKDPYSQKVATAQYDTSRTGKYCSQLFEPKLNVKPERIEELAGQTASLKLHFRDDPQGKIYLQCDYGDVYDVNNGLGELYEPVVEEDSNPNAKVDYDF